MDNRKNIVYKKNLDRGLLETDNSYFIPLNTDVDRDPMQWLIAAIKVTADNLGILHRHVIGKDFFNAHSVLEGYYKQMYEILDDVVEAVISLGGRELSMYEACKLCPSLKVQDFTREEAFSLVIKMFRMLINGFEKAREYIPGDVYSKFEEYIYWMRKECNYKLAEYFKEK